ncbi:MAG: dihydroneopterin aldolase [Verrucomicrobiae bacterium]|nr:dihydroneopterin aldolase [Verrucomicrobiae bacterium]
MPDRILIHDLEVLFHIGVPDTERARPQRLSLTLELHLDLSAAAAADDLERTVDYHAVSLWVRSLGEGRQWKLIETLAVEIAEGARTRFGVPSVTVEVKKFILPHARHVSVRVQRPAGQAP